ncbi:MAG: hypothetical protein ACOYLQ_18995 [Hyphomicrobiaceae bacterium]
MALRHPFLLAAALVVGAFGMSLPSQAAEKKKAAVAPAAEVGAGGHPASSYYRRGPQVRGYAARRGGYSFKAEDTINTYGDSRTRYGSTSFYRFNGVDRQTAAGPFDHGFFFDSGIGPRGGDSPYMN